MFKFRQVVMVVLLLAQGIFEALKEADDFSQLEEQIHKLSQQAADLTAISEKCYNSNK